LACLVNKTEMKSRR